MQKILIIEDDRALNQGLCKALKTDNSSMQVCRPLTLADGFKPGSLCRQVQTANAGKQAHMG